MSRPHALTEPTDLAGYAAAPAALEGTHPSGRGRRLVLVAWAVLAALRISFVLASALTDIAFWTGLPGSCPDAAVIPWCVDWSTSLIASYRHVGLSLGGVTMAGMVVQLTVTAVLWALAGLIVWRRPDDGMALLVALLLVTFDLPWYGWAWTWSHLGSKWQVLGALMAELGWIVLFLVIGRFPTGRFVPRWSRWLVLLDCVLAVPCWVLLGSPSIWIGPLVWLWTASAGGRRPVLRPDLSLSSY